MLISRAMVAGSQRARLGEIARLGVRLTVLAPDRWEYQRFEAGDSDGYELLEGHIRLGWKSLGRIANHTFYYHGIGRLIRREPWDLVHIEEEPFNFASFHAARLARRRNLPFIFSTWQNLMKSYPPPFNLFERSIFNDASGALPGNAEALAILRRRGFSGPAAVVPLAGVDPGICRRLDAVRFRRELMPGKSLIVGFVGRITREKGLETLFRAFASLPEDCGLCLAGSGPFQSELQGLAQSLGIGSRVRWIPWMKSSDVLGFMNSIDVLVLPSLTSRNWKEQFGRVLAEAMACETCVVGSDSGEIPNVVGNAGLIFHEGDERELAEHLRRLMEDASLRESLGRRGRERVLEHYTHAKIAQETVSFYRRVLRDGGREKLQDPLAELVRAPRSSPL